MPDDKNIVLVNILGGEFKASLLNSGGGYLRDCEEVWQFPSKEELARKVQGGRGETVQFHTREAVEDAGVYYIKMDVSIMDENRRRFSKSAYYMINVHNPTMAAEINLREEKPYYFSEKETFSFATVEFSDANAYSYQVLDPGQTVIEEGKGSVVNLDAVLSDIRNVAKTISIRGLYEGKEFQYISNGDKQPRNSTWSIKITSPSIEEFGDWQKSNPNDQIVISAYNKNARRILYTYFAKTDEGYVLIGPEARNFRLTCDPPNFIINQKPTTVGVFLYITFDFNEDMLFELGDFGQQALQVTIEFTTQFGEKKKTEYSALILK